ncbi:hypothetical protein ACWGDE_11305 [Streptomyces sp. NPDC054956]
MAQALATFHEPPRPSNLQIRYLTVGGSYVDVTGSGSPHDNNRWKCHGCKDGDDIYTHHYFFEARSKANDHANLCRAIPLT